MNAWRMMKERADVASSVELSQYFLWGIGENDKSVTQFNQSQTEIFPKAPEQQTVLLSTTLIDQRICFSVYPLYFCTCRASDLAGKPEPTTLLAKYLFPRLCLLNSISGHLVQVTLPDRDTFHTMNADGFIYSLSASERCCDVIICWNRSRAAVASLVFARTEPSRISPERLHLAPPSLHCRCC